MKGGGMKKEGRAATICMRLEEGEGKGRCKIGRNKVTRLIIY